MTPDQRKAAIASYKDRKTIGGIYAVTCRACGQRWIGRAPDLTTIQNRLWFTLRQGGCLNPSLQTAWNSHGPETFTLDVLERFDAETLAYVRDRMSAERLSHWCALHGAEAIS
jgi:hypothetical protein